MCGREAYGTQRGSIRSERLMNSCPAETHKVGQSSWVVQIGHSSRNLAMASSSCAMGLKCVCADERLSGISPIWASLPFPLPSRFPPHRLSPRNPQALQGQLRASA